MDGAHMLAAARGEWKENHGVLVLLILAALILFLLLFAGVI
ncbi:hypothetical protein AOX55_0000772 [Sinorhizobium fredii CCBAU 25509]|nr:hypothetical protein AOX55_0000772 [Sinorhizobium fredii CCBAU 25509]